MTANSIAVSKLLLSCGIKCRYLGRFATLAVAEERKYLVAQKYCKKYNYQSYVVRSCRYAGLKSK